MKRLLLKSILLFGIIIVTDYIVGSALQHMLLRDNSGAPGYVLNHIIDKPYDAYIMGASGAQRGYIPSVFEEELGLKVFNTGEAGTSILYNYAALQLILKHSKPKLIIWDITDAAYYYRPDAGKTGMITPFYRDDSIRQLLYSISPLNRIWLCSKIYPVNQKVLSLVGGYINKPSTGAAGISGYHPISGVMDTAKVANPQQQFIQEMRSVNNRDPRWADKDKLIREYFYGFIELCKANDIRLEAVYCPWAPLSEDISGIPLISEELVAELNLHDIPLHTIVPKQYPAMMNLGLYYDLYHLNDEGAKVFSTIVAKQLKAGLVIAR